MTKKKKTHRYEKAIHALMPLRLYEHLLRTAAEWAINGDLDVGEWFFNELLARDYQSRKAEFETMRRNTDELNKFRGKPCVSCGKPSNSIDHIIPLVRGGDNSMSNLQPMCNKCNSKKGDKLL